MEVKARVTSGRFASVLENTVQTSQDIAFSAHALRRLEDRQISVSSSEKAGIQRAVDHAAAKGAQESLVLTDRYALVVSVPNRTVITAVARDASSDAVFTNIDSAILVSSSNGPS